MGKMFKTVTETWNPFTGCLHGCSYCYARRLANGRLKHVYLANKNISRPVFQPYRMLYGAESSAGYDALADPFYPRFWPGRLKKTFKPGGMVFVADMSDLMGAWWPTEWIQAVVDRIMLFPRTDFLVCSKNPERYGDFVFPPNVILGTTLETNRETWKHSWAAPPEVRQQFLAAHGHPRKFVSIEPILDLDVEVMLQWVDEIKPGTVEVGADNYKNCLPEPSKRQVRALLDGLKTRVARVVEKDGLRRLV